MTSTQKQDQDKPAPIALNLDQLEHEGAAGPYVVVFGGERIVFKDAMEVDWQKLMAALRHPAAFFRLVLSPDDARKFLSTELPTHKLRKLMDGYRDHFGLVEPGE